MKALASCSWCTTWEHLSSWASVNSAAKDATNAPVKNENIVNAEKMLFGFSLGKHHVSNIELDSDQESTDGEEESVLKGEIPERLTPDWLLW